ncbi:MAG TPA: CxxxxCH/CxxCH domain-containing protein, partial [Anaeromyxobacteraceae bacterium]
MRNLRLATLALAGATLLACGKERRPAIGQAPGGQVTVPDPDGGPATTVDLAACTRCHGDVARSASGADPAVAVSPPRSVKGELASSARGVGAHQAHLVDGPLARAVACTSCHRIPSGIDDHAAPAGRVRFRGMATLGGAAPSYDAAAGSCASTYCHGSFRNGNAANAPAWTGPQAACDSCHAIPPPSPAAGGTHPAVGAPLACDGCHVGYTPDTVNAATHVDGRIDVSGSCSLCHGDPPPPPPAGTTPLSHHPQNDRCSLCHDGYSDGTATPRTTGSTHMDGKVDHVALSCTTCHGDPARPGSDAKGQALAPAPPSDSTGEVASGAVGAHQAHLVSPSSSARVACDECHAVPAAGSELHADATAGVAFGALARTVLPGDGRTVTPVWTAASLTCSATYCHGNFRNGNAGNAPAWTGTAGCGSCHDLPPAGTHPAAAPGACATCHPGYAAGAPDPLTHLDGQVDLSLTCSSCHGDAARLPVASATALDPLGANLVKASPPLDTQGGTGPAVGAHLAHVNQGATAPELSAAIACATCHPVPTGLAHSNLSVDVAFTGVAAASGASFAAGTHTCSSTYCHGNFPGGNGANPVVWTAAGKLACTACHGSPPGPVSAAVHHPQNPTCGACHAGYTASLVVAATHVDGTVQKPPAGCTQCHGDLTAAGVASTDVRAAPASNA